MAFSLLLYFNPEILTFDCYFSTLPFPPLHMYLLSLIIISISLVFNLNVEVKVFPGFVWQKYILSEISQ
jgi:hypothetical protein